MSDPPKKPGSLRDRIAAFEKSGPTTPPAPAPAPRPKPGGLSWKPKALSPPSSPPAGDHDAESTNAAGMSAADAKASIGAGGSLKERMAALQGRGAFGAPGAAAAPPPKPAVEKPKLKSPPVVATPTEKDENEGGDIKAKAHESEDGHEGAAPRKSEGDDGEQAKVECGEEQDGETDPAEEERQRRAAIAARMARLGGARVGMGPPIFGKKPDVKKTDIHKEDREKPATPAAEGPELDTSDSVKSPHSDATLATDYVGAKSASGTSLSSDSSRNPAMPVPAGPRRTAPPRKRAPKSTPPAPVADEELKPSVPADTQTDAISPDALPVPVSHDESADTSVQIIAQTTNESDPALVIEPADPLIVKDEPIMATLATEVVHDESAITVQSASLAETAHDDATSASPTVGAQHQPEYESVPPAETNEPEGLLGEEESEESRRKRIAERLAKSGGAFNPFAGPPPPQRKASLSPSVISQDFESAQAEDVSRRTNVRKASTDSATSPVSPRAEKRTSLRQGNTDINASSVIERRTSVRQNSTDSTSQAPLVSPKPVPTRGDSVGSALSHGDAPIRKASLDGDDDDRREFKSNPLSGPGTANADPDRGYAEYELEDDEEQEGLGYEVRQDTARGRHDVGHIGTGHEVTIEEEEPLSGDDGVSVYSYPEEVGPEDNAEEVYIEGSERLSQYSRRSSFDVEAAPPPPPPPPARPLPSTAIQSPKAETYGVSSPIITERVSVPPPPRAPPAAPHLETRREVPTKRTSLPPPPRALPVEPRESLSEHNVERVTSPHLPRRDLPPPPVPHEETVDEGDEDHNEEVESWSRPSSQADHAHYDTSASELEDRDDIPYEGEESEIYEEPPLPPSRPGVVANVSRIRPDSSILNPGVAHEGNNEGSLDHPHMHAHSPLHSQIAPPPPPERKTRPISSTSPSARPLPKLTSIPGTRLDHPLTVDVRSEREILDDSDVDPIDPGFLSPRKSVQSISSTIPSATSAVEPPPLPTESAQVPAPTSPISAKEAKEEGDAEQVRRQTIAERMAKLGGIRFGAPPTITRVQAPAPVHHNDDEPDAGSPVSGEHDEQPTDEEEIARKQRIAAKMAGMGGMRFGMPPMASPPVQQAQPNLTPDEDEEAPPPPPRRASLPRPPPARRTTEQLESDNNNVVAHEMDSSIEHSDADVIHHEEAEDDAPLPPVPSRAGRHVSSTQTHEVTKMRPSSPPTRPPVPVVTRMSRPTTQPQAPTHSAKRSVDSGLSYPPPHATSSQPPPEDYSMVEQPEISEDSPPPPPPRPSRAPPPVHTSLPPAPPVPAPDDNVEPPESIPAFDFGEDTDLSLTEQWSEDSRANPSSPPPPPPPEKSKVIRSPIQAQGRQAGPPAMEVHLSADELMAQWGRVGVQVCEVATTLQDNSKKMLVGDGTYIGFVMAVLRQVPNAVPPTPTYDSFGYLIYAQTGSTVQRRSSDIMPGDIIVMNDAKLKGHKGITTYHQHVGTPEPLVAVISDYEQKKSKIKVFQANQHVGQQSVESVSYRLDDLKSGSVKIFRVMEA